MSWPELCRSGNGGGGRWETLPGRGWQAVNPVLIGWAEPGRWGLVRRLLDTKLRTVGFIFRNGVRG